MKQAILFIVTAGLLGSGMWAAGEKPGASRDYYVAVTGADSNAGTEHSPFLTIERARQAVREKLANGVTGPMRVVIGGGVYRLTETLVFGAADSGRADGVVTYTAASSEEVVVSGGKVITGWEPDQNGRWKAKTDLKDFRQLYINGVRGVRARQVLNGSESWYNYNISGKNKEGDELELFGEDGYRTKSAALAKMADWVDAGGVEFNYVYVWCHSICKVQRVRRDGDYTVITMQQPQFTWAKKKEGVHINQPTYIENAIELLDEPGEWYLDRSAGVVYYLPRSGEDMTKAVVVAPALEKVVELRGTLDEPVHDICFSGITFADGSWLSPSERGLVDVQANLAINPEGLLDRKDGLTNIHNEHLKGPANIICHTAHHIRFENCVFTRLGGAGVDIESGSWYNQIESCQFREISGSAVQIGNVLREDHHPKDVRSINKNNSVTRCLIENCAVDYMGGVGVFVGYTEGTVLAENEIRNMPYSGISMGWGWGEEDAGGGSPNYYQPFKFDTPTIAKNNRIENNHIHHVIQKMDDGGGIYTLGNQPGTVICGNRVHDNHGRPGGIYLDEGSGFIEVSGNGVENISRAINVNPKQGRAQTCIFKGNACKEDFTLYADKDYYAAFPEIMLNGEDIVVYFERQKLAELRASELHPHYQPVSHIYYAWRCDWDWNWDFSEQSPKLKNLIQTTRHTFALSKNEILDMRYYYVRGTMTPRGIEPTIYQGAFEKNEIFKGPIEDLGPCKGIPFFVDFVRLPDGSLLASAAGDCGEPIPDLPAEGEIFKKRWPEGYRTSTAVFFKGSADGKHWRYLSHIPNRHVFAISEPAMTVYPDGRVVAILRTDWPKPLKDIFPAEAGACEEKYGYFLYQSESKDFGQTWSELVQLPIWGHPANLVQLKSGNLLMVYGYRQKPQGFRAVLSRDQGRTWDLATLKTLKTFEPGSYDIGYPVAVQLPGIPEGRIFCCGYGYSTSDVGEKQPHGIFGCIFTEDWLMQP